MLSDVRIRNETENFQLNAWLVFTRHKKKSRDHQRTHTHARVRREYARIKNEPKMCNAARRLMRMEMEINTNGTNRTTQCNANPLIHITHMCGNRTTTNGRMKESGEYIQTTGFLLVFSSYHVSKVVIASLGKDLRSDESFLCKEMHFGLASRHAKERETFTRIVCPFKRTESRWNWTIEYTNIWQHTRTPHTYSHMHHRLYNFELNFIF